MFPGQPLTIAGFPHLSVFRCLFPVVQLPALVFDLCELFLPFLNPLFDLLFHPLLGRLVVVLVCAKIVLCHKMSRMIVRILIALAVPQTFCAFVARVAQGLRYW